MAFVLGVVTQLTFHRDSLLVNVCCLETTGTLFFYGGRPGVEAETLHSVLYKLRRKRTILEL